MQTVARVAVTTLPGEDPASALARALGEVALRQHRPPPPPSGLQPDDPALVWARLAHREYSTAQRARAEVDRAEAAGRTYAARCAALAFLAGFGAALALAAAGAG